MTGQEREALEAWKKRRGMDDNVLPSECFVDGYRAALVARVEIDAYRQALTEALDALDKWTAMTLPEGTARAVAHDRLLSVLAAREEPQGEMRETAWAAWLASWENEPGDEDAFVAWWESYLRVSQLPLDDAVVREDRGSDDEPREWLVEANENARARNPKVSYWRVLGEPRLGPSERIHVVEFVRDTEQEHER
jgi:hypothetical protein